MRAQFVLFDGFDPLDVIAPLEVLYTAAMVTEDDVRFAFELVTAEGARDVPSGVPGLSLRATAALDPAVADLVLVPGAGGTLPTGAETTEEELAGTIPGILGSTLGTQLPALIKAALDRPETLVMTICGGSLIPAMAGLIDGRPVTTHHIGNELLDSTGARRIDARVVDDGDLISGAGVTSGLDAALHLIERELGPQVAHTVETLFAYERRGIAWADRGRVPTV
ncbi:DJ-1/PfpI family protein [Nocardia arthritidis]|uniref:DJ-1/PfpI family protein n=1 Tax=Nocardia arthritidis TaxID=228602 RepID=A0A6G9YAG4_9NOCA|nr:DJ-1/PfpI family protein [Nocardia arthritidis]QIS10110.1 DJ-1/PfpI family protein [Nocardia arthritidis]